MKINSPKNINGKIYKDDMADISKYDCRSVGSVLTCSVKKQWHFFFLIFSLFIFFLASASADQTLGTFQINQNISLLQNCLNSSYSNITRIVNPDSTFAVNAQTAMTRNGDNYNYSFTSASDVGNYLVYGQCDENGAKENWAYDFLVTKSGFDPAGDFLEMFIYILFIIVTLGLFFTFIMQLAKLATLETTIYDVLLTWGTYVLAIITNYLGKNYLLTNLVEDMTNGYITYTAWTNVVFPLIAFIIVFFAKSMQKKRPLSVKEISGRQLVHG